MRAFLLLAAGFTAGFVVSRRTAPASTGPGWTQPGEPMERPVAPTREPTAGVSGPERSEEAEGTRFNALVEAEAEERREAARRLMEDPLTRDLDDPSTD